MASANESAGWTQEGIENLGLMEALPVLETLSLIEAWL